MGGLRVWDCLWPGLGVFRFWGLIRVGGIGFGRVESLRFRFLKIYDYLR